jgi:hypothetical protein
MVPVIEAVKEFSSVRAGTGNAPRFPRPCGTVPRRPAGPGTPAGQRLPGAGRALAGGLGPRLAWDQRGAVAGAMAPAIEAAKVRSLVRAGPGNAPRFPARAGQCPVDRHVQKQRRPAPDPAGEKRPPGAGRALAGGFGPPAGLGSAWRCGRGDSPCQCSGEGAFVGAGGTRKRTAFPRPRGTVPRRPAGPGITEASARRGRGGRWPGALGPRLARDQRGAVAGAMAPANEAVKVLLSVRAGTGNALRFPARAGRFPADRQVRE